ncbi:MAG: hypothetical protein R3A46_15880 [Thermomicrobiales bacterium]
MIISAMVMLVLAIVLLAYVLEPVIRAHVDRVELDAPVHSPPVPDFRSLLDEEADEPEEERVVEEQRQPSPNPEPAEHRS